tara:strand:- start:444 stop:1409 length:966 start_codon:yes stop_codon:yes gene_type:complete
MYAIQPVFNRDWILERVPQEQIMEYYLQVPVQVKNKFHSPIREDNNPSCSFFYTKAGKLYFRDFSKSESLDCFDVACLVLGQDFKATIRQIIDDLNLRGGTFVPRSYKHLDDAKASANEASTISINPLTADGKWHMDDDGLAFWSQFGITADTLIKYKVFQLYQGYCNGKRVYTHRTLSPAFAYYFGNDLFKLYMPFSTGSRFMQNTQCLQGYNQLPESADLLVVTKSLKDVMVFHEYGIAAVAPQSESYSFSDEEVQDWKKRFKRIVIVYDRDYTGVKFANKWRKLYGWDYCFVQGAKDLSDLYKASPYEAEQWIHLLRS